MQGVTDYDDPLCDRTQLEGRVETWLLKKQTMPSIRY